MTNSKNKCLSCNYTLAETDKYCPQCGLESKYRNLSIRFLIKSFFEAFLNFDVKIFHSMRDIWVPNKITKTFLEGKREYHIHPFRFYFICLIIFFALLSVWTKNLEFNDYNLNEVIAEYELFQEFDTISQNYIVNCEPGIMDSIKTKLYNDSDLLDRDTFFNATIFGSDLSDYGISTLDAFKLENEEMFEKYNVTSKKDQYTLSQFKRVAMQPESATRFFIGNLIWGLILLTIMIAAVLKLLYIRHESYYIEHLLHVSNVHCLILLLTSIVMMIHLIHPFESFPEMILFALLGGVLYFIVSIKSYYGENIFKTFCKFLILFALYIFCIVIILMIIGVFSLLVF